jgi:hypothetical protein
MMHPWMSKFNIDMFQGHHQSCQDPQMFIISTSLVGLHQNSTKPFKEKMFADVHFS